MSGEHTRILASCLLSVTGAGGPPPRGLHGCVLSPEVGTHHAPRPWAQRGRGPCAELCRPPSLPAARLHVPPAVPSRTTRHSLGFSLLTLLLFPSVSWLPAWALGAEPHGAPPALPCQPAQLPGEPSLGCVQCPPWPQRPGSAPCWSASSRPASQLPQLPHRLPPEMPVLAAEPVCSACSPALTPWPAHVPSPGTPFPLPCSKPHVCLMAEASPGWSPHTSDFCQASGAARLENVMDSAAWGWLDFLFFLSFLQFLKCLQL